MSTGGFRGKGSDSENEYFRQQDRKLIEEQRKSLDTQRAEQERNARQRAHWMKCPKCGEDMVEVELEAVMVDQCTACRGIYFDAGEVDLMLKSHQPAQVFQRLGKLFK